VSSGKEKRKYPRKETHIPVRYRYLGDPVNAFKAGTITRNIGEGGVRFNASEFVSRASRLMLEMDVPMLTRPVKAISKVAWIRKSPSGETYDIGNQFLEISRENKKDIARYVDSLSMYNDGDEEA
jgi:hypothetical protein